MSKKKVLKCVNNKKAVRSSLERSAAVLRAFKREHIIELPMLSPGPISVERILFPIFDSEKQS